MTATRISTSLKINPELWKEAKIEAIREGLGVSEMLELALKKHIAKLRKERERRN